MPVFLSDLLVKSFSYCIWSHLTFIKNLKCPQDKTFTCIIRRLSECGCRHDLFPLLDISYGLGTCILIKTFGHLREPKFKNDSGVDMGLIADAR